MKNPIIMEQADKNDTIEKLERDNKNLLIKIAEQADKIAQLSEWKADKAVAIAEADNKQQMLEDKSKQLEKMEQLYNTEKERADSLHLDLQKEINRPLTWRERLTGRKE